MFYSYAVFACTFYSVIHISALKIKHHIHSEDDMIIVSQSQTLIVKSSIIYIIFMVLYVIALIFQAG